MSKIYEALQQAKDMRKVVASPTGAQLTLFSDAFPDSGAHKSIMEKEMVALFYKLDSLLNGLAKKAVQFIGAMEGEGTSTIVQEFAKLCVVQLHMKVVILDAGYYVQGKYNSLPEAADYVADKAIINKDSVDKTLHKIGGLDLYVGPVSERSRATSQIFDGNAIRTFIESLKQNYDLVLIDSLPAVVSNSWATLSHAVDGVVMVLEAEKTRRPVAEHLRDKIMNNGGKILGVVFNKQHYYIPPFIYKRL